MLHIRAESSFDSLCQSSSHSWNIRGKIESDLQASSYCDHSHCWPELLKNKMVPLCNAEYWWDLPSVLSQLPFSDNQGRLPPQSIWNNVPSSPLRWPPIPLISPSLPIYSPPLPFTFHPFSSPFQPVHSLNEMWYVVKLTVCSLCNCL